MYGDLSPYEQLLLELVNRARLDPSSEAARFGMRLNQDLPEGTIADFARQPLAPNPLLFAAARDHSTWMLEANIFSHIGAGGTTPGERMEAAGYSLATAWNWGENVAWRGTTGAANLEALTYALHRDLFFSAGHRFNLLQDVFQEVGTGMATGRFVEGGISFNTLMAAQSFARSGDGGSFITGVAINDVDGDNFYDIGEGRGGIAVTVSESGVELGTDVTASGGGYAISVSGGMVDVTFSGGDLSQSVTVTVDTNARNAKVDLVGASEILSSADTVLGEGALDLVLLGSGDLDGAGNGADNRIWGNRGDNVLTGGAGNDTLTGGNGFDQLAGGEGSDLFRFASRCESGTAEGTSDTITDFMSGVDRIDLSGIDARLRVRGNQAFKWIGDSDFHDKRGELHYVLSEAGVVVEGDVNGDGRGDFKIVLENVSSVTKSDFIL